MRATSRFPGCSRRRRAFTLIELIVVMSLLSVIMGLLTMTLWGIIRVEHGSRAAFDRLYIDATLADQFREDVGQAAAAPERWQKESAGPDCLILQMIGGRHIVYRWEEGKLLRHDFPSAGNPASRILFAQNRVTASFTRAEPGSRVLILRLAESQRHHGPDLVLEIAAALGGEGR